jgi:hypothetical protein
VCGLETSSTGRLEFELGYWVTEKEIQAYHTIYFQKTACILVKRKY